MCFLEVLPVLGLAGVEGGDLVTYGRDLAGLQGGDLLLHHNRDLLGVVPLLWQLLE